MFKFFRRSKNKGRHNRSEEDAAEIEELEIDPNSPLARNQKFFDKLNRDIEEGTLPQTRKPSKRDITACEERRREQLERAQAAYDAEDQHEEWGAVYSLKRVQANQEIPVEVELWVDAICDHYLSKAKPMMGLVHWESDVRKRLYESRGYTWYSIQDIYPLVHFD